MPSQELFDRAYSQRAVVIKLLCVTAAKMGYDYGWGINNNETWETEWRRVVYVQLPEGQYSWHIAPQDWHLFERIKKFEGVWDGSFDGQSKDHAAQIEFGAHSSHLVPGWEYEYKDVEEHPEVEKFIKDLR